MTTDDSSSNKQTIGGVAITHFRLRPATFTASFHCEGYGRVADAIRAAREAGGVAKRYLISIEDDSAGWQPADGIAEADSYGEIKLTVWAVSEHDAERAVRKVLEQATRDAPPPPTP